MDNLSVVLVQPLYAGNVGSVCRAMANMGVSDLRLVSPRFADWSEAGRMACHALPLLESRRIFDTLSGAVADCVAVAGTTVRLGLYRRHVRSPRDWAPDLLRLAGGGGRVALVLGREDCGLLNDEIALCTHLVRIPSHPGYPSLNLAQAALVLLYELFLAGGEYEEPVEKSELATLELRERMIAMWRDTLLRAGFMDEDKADHMMQGVRRIFARGALTVDDVNIMLGAARQTQWAINRQRR